MRENAREIVERFMKHGIDISPYQFQCYEDKFHFFTMYIRYLESMDDGATGYITDFDESINLEVYDNSHALIGKFLIAEDYKTLRFLMDSQAEVTEEYAQHINFLVTVFFLALKEFNASIQHIAEIFGKSSLSKNEKQEKHISDFDKKINKIMQLQKMIRSENEKYKISSTDKGEDDE